MARYLALDWDHNQLHVVLANVSGATVRVLHAAAWPEPTPVTAADAAAAGARLKERLKEAKIPAAPVLASLGRERIIVKDIRYPVVPAHEEPAVVRFQAVKELTGAAEDAVIDYTPIGDSPGGERRALVLVAKRDVVNAYQELCKAAGLKLAAITPRPFGLATAIDRLAGTTVLTPRPDPADGAVAVLAVSEGWAEFCVCRGGTLLLARSLVPGPNLAAEVRRSLAVYAGQSPSQPVRAVYVAGGADNATLRERLHNLTELPVHLLDPFAGSDGADHPAPEKRGGLVGLVGLLHLSGSRGGLPVNFAAPKQPRPPADPNRRKLVLGLAAAAAVLVAVGGLAFMEITKLDRLVKAQQVTNQDLDKQLAASEDDDKRIKAVAAWVDQNANFLDEFYDLTARFPDPDKDSVRLSLFTADLVDRPTGSKDKDKDKDKFVAKLSLKGVSGEELRAVDQLVTGYGTDRYYSSDPKKVSPNRGADRRTYSQEFTVQKIDVRTRQPEQYTRQIQVKADEDKAEERQPDRRRGGRGGQ